MDYIGAAFRIYSNSAFFLLNFLFRLMDGNGFSDIMLLREAMIQSAFEVYRI